MPVLGRVSRRTLELSRRRGAGLSISVCKSAHELKHCSWRLPLPLEMRGRGSENWMNKELCCSKWWYLQGRGTESVGDLVKIKGTELQNCLFWPVGHPGKYLIQPVVSPKVESGEESVPQGWHQSVHAALKCWGPDRKYPVRRGLRCHLANYLFLETQVNKWIQCRCRHTGHLHKYWASESINHLLPWLIDNLLHKTNDLFIFEWMFSSRAHHSFKW